MKSFQIFAIFMANVALWACSKPAAPPPGPLLPQTPPGAVDWSKSDTPALEAAAVAGEPAAQREWAGRLLFGQGVPQDIPAALAWTEKAARGGDARAAVWMGRKLLGEEERVSAAAWFLVAAESDQPGSAQDARAELEALTPTAEELASARALADGWQTTIIRPSAGGSK